MNQNLLDSVFGNESFAGADLLKLLSGGYSPVVELSALVNSVSELAVVFENRFQFSFTLGDDLHLLLDFGHLLIKELLLLVSSQNYNCVVTFLCSAKDFITFLFVFLPQRLFGF